MQLWPSENNAYVLKKTFQKGPRYRCRMISHVQSVLLFFLNWVNNVIYSFYYSRINGSCLSWSASNALEILRLFVGLIFDNNCLCSGNGHWFVLALDHIRWCLACLLQKQDKFFFWRNCSSSASIRRFPNPLDCLTINRAADVSSHRNEMVCCTSVLRNLANT